MRRVVKIGGRAQEDPALAAALARAWDETPGALAIVHGGGDAVSALQRAMGVEPQFIGGRRVTTASDVELVRMAVSGAANKRLVARLVSAGANALGVSGEDAVLLGARALAGTTLGRVGAPASVNAALLRYLWAGGYLPVISPLARELAHPEGAPLNVNGDDAAAAIAVALDAEELLFVSDVEGVILDGARVRELDARDAARAIAAGAASGGMAVKLAAAAHALARGVARVRIGGAGMLEDRAAGTALTGAQAAA